MKFFLKGLKIVLEGESSYAIGMLYLMQARLYFSFMTTSSSFLPNLECKSPFTCSPGYSSNFSFTGAITYESYFITSFSLVFSIRPPFLSHGIPRRSSNFTVLILNTFLFADAAHLNCPPLQEVNGGAGQCGRDCTQTAAT